MKGDGPMSDGNEPSSAYVKVGRVEDFPEGRGKRVSVAGRHVAVFHVEGRFYALLDKCTHGQAPLSRGTVKGECVMCPRHGAHFDLATGTVLTLQAVRNVESFPVLVTNGEVYVSTESRVAESLWALGRRLDQGAPDPKEAFME